MSAAPERKTEWFDDSRIREFWMVQVGTETRSFNSKEDAISRAMPLATEQVAPLIYRCTLDSVITVTTHVVSIEGLER